MIVLRDTHHLTATFARSLAPAIDRALKKILQPSAALVPSPSPTVSSPSPTVPSPSPVAPNQMDRNPLQYETADLKVRLASGG
jgi:hypothetical protein